MAGPEAPRGVPQPDRGDYRLNLTIRVMDAVNPVFDQLQTPQEERNLFKKIISGEVGSIGVGIPVIAALRDAGLLQSGGSVSYCDFSLPGWRDMLGRVVRVTDYKVTLPYEEIKRDYKGVGRDELRLHAGYDKSQETVFHSGTDYTRWTLVREDDYQ